MTAKVEDLEFLESIKIYIEDSEMTAENEFGEGRTLNDLILGGEMPGEYDEVLFRILECNKIETVESDHVLREAIEFYGAVNQLHQAVEELNELCVAINHSCRGRKDADSVAEEMADALIMMKQVAMILHVDPHDHMTAKLDRLKRRIDGLE